MINDGIVQQMARKYEMNPDMARKLLEMARAQPAIAKLCREYDKLREGDTVGKENSKECSGRVGAGNS